MRNKFGFVRSRHTSLIVETNTAAFSSYTAKASNLAREIIRFKAVGLFKKQDGVASVLVEDS